MKLKRVLAFLLVACMLFCFAACGEGNGDTSTTTTTVDSAAEVETDETEDGSNGVTKVTKGTGNNGEGGGKTSSSRATKSTAALNTVKPQGGSSTMGAIKLKEGTKRVTDGLNFGGKTFTFAYYGSSWDDDHKAWHKDFEKQYNVKLNVRGVDTAKYVEGLSSAMAAKNPYDIVFLYSFDYPEEITANVMAPLNDYVTTADLWNKSKKEGFSKSLMQAHSLNGNIYCVAGNYLQTPTVIWYNKKMFKDAGYDGKNDPLEMYKAGKFTWSALYDMLTGIQDKAKGRYGINTFGYWGDHQVINSFGTDVAKLTSDGRIVQNLNDPQLYKALETLQKFCYGEQSVVNPNDPYENGIPQFMNGTTAAVVNTGGAFGTFYQEFQKKPYAAFGAQATQLDNLGVVPLPTESASKVHSIWDWMGYGAGNGATPEGIKCAIAFAFHDSQVNHYQAYYKDKNPAWMKQLFCEVLDSDNLIGPMDGFSSSAGSLGSIQGSLTSNVAKGQNITVVLKGYEKLCQTVIDTALKA